jgi:hypothetical protein
VDGYRGKERRVTSLSEDQLDAIAERAAQKALDKIYSEVGQNVVKRLLWVLGVVLISGMIWLARTGKLIT